MSQKTPPEFTDDALSERIKTLEEALAAATRNLTDRKIAEKALSESETKYRMLFESMRNGICFVEAIYDAQGTLCDGRYLEMNAVYEKFTGLDRKMAVGRTVTEMLPGTESSWFEILDPAVKSGKPIRFEMFHKIPPGSTP